ncbi:unnamed protein product [Amoebophrya sp. A120]|nr:unnamed protein product [Amoebophrya sp. A120]|eukprot:GSA120T00001968001.1
MQLGPEHSLLTQAFREAALDYVQIAGVDCFDRSPYAMVFGITSAKIVRNYQLFATLVSEKYLEWWEYSRFYWRHHDDELAENAFAEACPAPGEDVLLLPQDVVLADHSSSITTSSTPVLGAGTSSMQHLDDSAGGVVVPDPEALAGRLAKLTRIFRFNTPGDTLNAERSTYHEEQLVPGAAHVFQRHEEKRVISSLEGFAGTVGAKMAARWQKELQKVISEDPGTSRRRMDDVELSPLPVFESALLQEQLEGIIEDGEDEAEKTTAGATSDDKERDIVDTASAAPSPNLMSIAFPEDEVDEEDSATFRRLLTDLQRVVSSSISGVDKAEKTDSVEVLHEVDIKALRLAQTIVEEVEKAASAYVNTLQIVTDSELERQAQERSKHPPLPQVRQPAPIMNRQDDHPGSSTPEEPTAPSAFQVKNTTSTEHDPEQSVVKSQNVKLLCALPLVWPAEADFRRAILDTWGGREHVAGSCDEIYFFVALPDDFCSHYCAERDLQVRSSFADTVAELEKRIITSVPEEEEHDRSEQSEDAEDVNQHQSVVGQKIKPSRGSLLTDPKFLLDLLLGRKSVFDRGNSQQKVRDDEAARGQQIELEKEAFCRVHEDEQRTKALRQDERRSEQSQREGASDINLHDEQQQSRPGTSRGAASCLPFGVFDLRQTFPGISPDRSEYTYKYSDANFSFTSKHLTDQDKNTVAKVLHMFQFVHRGLRTEIESKGRARLQHFLRLLFPCQFRKNDQHEGGSSLSKTAGLQQPASEKQGHSESDRGVEVDNTAAAREELQTRSLAEDAGVAISNLRIDTILASAPSSHEPDRFWWEDEEERLMLLERQENVTDASHGYNDLTRPSAVASRGDAASAGESRPGAAAEGEGDESDTTTARSRQNRGNAEPESQGTTNDEEPEIVSQFWTCRLERDTWFFPNNVRRLVRDLDVTDWSYNLGIAHLYELWDGRRPWNDGGPGVCLSGGALDRLAKFLWKMDHHVTNHLAHFKALPMLDSEQCQPYAKGFREDKFLNACLTEALIFPDIFSRTTAISGSIATTKEVEVEVATSSDGAKDEAATPQDSPFEVNGPDVKRRSGVVRDEFGRDKFVIVPWAKYYSTELPVQNPMRAWIHRESASWNYFKGRTAQFLHCSGFAGRMPRLIFSNFPVSFNSFKELPWFYEMNAYLMNTFNATTTSNSKSTSLAAAVIRDQAPDTFVK